MNNVFDFIINIIVAFFASLVVVLTRGDGENIAIKVIIGTILGAILLSILRIY